MSAPQINLRSLPAVTALCCVIAGAVHYVGALVLWLAVGGVCVAPVIALWSRFFVRAPQAATYLTACGLMSFLSTSLLCLLVARSLREADQLRQSDRLRRMGLEQWEQNDIRRPAPSAEPSFEYLNGYSDRRAE